MPQRAKYLPISEPVRPVSVAPKTSEMLSTTFSLNFSILGISTTLLGMHGAEVRRTRGPIWQATCSSARAAIQSSVRFDRIVRREQEAGQERGTREDGRALDPQYLRHALYPIATFD